MRTVFAILAGSLFGTGLMISGMTDTTKVQGWLDVLGAWDPTLAFVLGGAILPMLLAWRMTTGRRPRLGGNFPAQPDPVLDARLLGGSALFGIGWAVAGLCPGPAMASLSFGGTEGLAFFGAMVIGMVVVNIAAPRQLAEGTF